MMHPLYSPLQNFMSWLKTASDPALERNALSTGKQPGRFHRILIVTDAWEPQVNGVVNTLLRTIEHLEQTGLKVDVLTPDHFFSLPCPGEPLVRLALTHAAQVAKCIEDSGADALHIATEGPLGWAARAAARHKGWSYTTAYHTRFPEYLQARFGVPTAVSYRGLKRFHRHAHAVLVPTEDMRQDLGARGFDRLVHWSRGVDHTIFHAQGRSSVKRCEAPVFLYAGRLAAEKNVDAFLGLDLPGEKWVAGDGPEAPRLRKQYPGVRFLGMLSPHALADAYRQSDVFVFPSRTDTFGLVMIEAMACGLPVAAFPVAGPLDVIGQSQAGVLGENLRETAMACLDLPADKPISRAASFTWARATDQFLAALVPMRALSES
jgi:glycosyltransferase involved in cell wall biosynthesis